MQRYEGGNNPGNDASGEDNRTKAPKILHKSSKELYRAVAKQWGITCKMSDHCRCLDCQVSVPLHRCNIEYFHLFNETLCRSFSMRCALHFRIPPSSNSPPFKYTSLYFLRNIFDSESRSSKSYKLEQILIDSSMIRKCKNNG